MSLDDHEFVDVEEAATQRCQAMAFDEVGREAALPVTLAVSAPLQSEDQVEVEVPPTCPLRLLLSGDSL